MAPDSPPPSERSDAPAPRRGSSFARGAGADPPTILSGQNPAAAGSSARRLGGGQGPAPDPAGAVAPLPRPGERIDVFLLEEPIGVGGMGAVFRAQDTRLERQVALKILPPEQARDPEVVQRYYQEGRAAARLDHENIARVYTIGHDGRYHYIAFEYIEGTTVRQRVERQGPLPVGEAINFTLQIADALVHAADRGVVHRDIKPSNIIVTPQGRAKLVDMGLARRFERGGDDGLTQSGMTLGTFDYISPEQARDPRDVDVRSDLYSLGCTLFHMLTGRPPFPEGTVLQKLIQHQEEAPPDVRSLNPAVPPELAGILVKLMAKERDRRYQTPEQLVRDLLTVAGALGLRSVSPEGLLWLAADPPPGRGRHLVWAVPSAAFLAIVGGLVWWGQDAAAPPAAATEPPTVVTVRPPPDAPGVKGRKPAVADAKADANPSGPAAAVAGADDEEFADVDPGRSPLPPPRDRRVGSSEDLPAAIAAAPPRSVLRLTDDGPYVIPDAPRAADRLARRDLTLKADAGARPVVRLGRDRGGLAGSTRPALLYFEGGSVTLEGIEFVLDPAGRTEPLAAVRAVDAELTVRRCVFRRADDPSAGGPGASAAHLSAVDARASAGVDRPPAVTIEASHVQGGLAGVRSSGPLDLSVRDTTFAGPDPLVWLDDAGASPPAAVDVRLRHVSVLAGASPVFWFEGAEPRVRVEDSVFASAPGAADATLVAADRPEALDWRGRGNLYARVGAFLRSTDDPARRRAVRDPARWQDDAGLDRETGSTFAAKAAQVWADPDPLDSLAETPADPSRAFLLVDDHPGPPGVGARRGPAGPVPWSEPTAAVKAAAAPPRAGRSDAADPPTERPATAGVATPARPTEGANLASAANTNTSTTPTTKGAGADATTDPEDPSAAEIAKMGDMPVMPIMPTTPAVADREKGAEPPAVAPEKAPTAAATTTATTPTAERAASSRTPNVPAGARGAVAGDVLRTADQWLNALGAPGARGGELTVAADADWMLSGVRVRAGGSWRVKAAPGAAGKRPRLRFLPDPAAAPAPGDWASMIDLASGSLQLEGFDVILPAMNAPRSGRWAAFLARPGTELSLTDCTVTVEGPRDDSAVVALVGVDPNLDPENVDAGGGAADAGAETSAASVIVSNGLLRAGGDLVDVGGGRRLVLELSNAVAATGGSLVHAHGVARGLTPERVNLTLRHVTAWAAGGLVRLDSSAAEPDLPQAAVSASNTVLAAGPGDEPLVRVDGQDVLASARDRVDWEGQGVAYHQVLTYRRDQSAQVGTVPDLYDRRDWRTAVGPRETGDFHGDVKFVRPWPPELPPWRLRRDDVRLAPESPAPSAGALLDRIPAAPSALD